MAAVQDTRTFENGDESVTVEVEESVLRLTADRATVRFRIDAEEAIPIDGDAPKWCDGVIRRLGLCGIQRGEA